MLPLGLAIRGVPAQYGAPAAPIARPIAEKSAGLEPDRERAVRTNPLAPLHVLPFVAFAWIAAVACSLACEEAGAAVAVSGGDRHSLALHADGTVRAWGADEGGQLGARPIYLSTPLPIQGLHLVSQIASGRLHSLARRSDGSVWGWGYNATGPLGDGTAEARSRPTPSLLTGAAFVAGGGHQSFAIKMDGSLWAFGHNDYGQLGDGSTISRWSPVPVPGMTAVRGVATGFSHTIAVKNDGTVWSWGANLEGELGTGFGTGRLSPAQVAGLADIVAVAAPVTGAHSVALKADGTVWAWGSNDLGQLGDGSTTDRAFPVQVQGLSNVVAIAAGRLYTLAIRSDGTLWAWGSNFSGELGDGTRNFRPNAAPVAGISSVIRIAAGESHTLAVTSDGSVWAWGGNGYGEVGDGSTSDRLTPYRIVGITNAVDVSAGHGQSFAVKSDGTALAWGSNIAGQLGDGAPIRRTVPWRTPVLTAVTGISAGDSHSLAVRADGTAWSWGANFSGELGDGTYLAHSTPAQIASLSTVAEVSAGSTHSLARTTAGAVYSWGYNDHGQLGNGTLVGAASPTLVGGVTAKAIAAGNRHSVAVATDGTVWTWGSNDRGQLGDGTTTERLSPVQVPGLAGVVAVAARGWHTTALKADGTVWTWGLNDAGQLGDGTTANRSSPAQVAGITGVVAIANGYNRTIALKGDGTVWVWGAGPLGNGGWTASSVPVAISGLAGMVAVASSSYHLLALKGDGTVWAWGDNGHGQVGDGTYVSREQPVVVLAEDGAGTLDGNDWFLDLDPAASGSIAASHVPKALAIAQRVGADDRIELDATAKYKAAEFGGSLNTYVTALVPPVFFDLVKSAPGESARASSKLKAGETLVLAQLTPSGWSVVVGGQLIAYSQAVANAAGAAANILDRVNGTLIPGARFCIGYGSDAQSMLGSQTLREVLALQAEPTSVSSVACMLSGVYLDGPASSVAGTTVGINVAVVGLGPTGSVQLSDGPEPLMGPLSLAPANEAVSKATMTTASLAPGPHSIGASYSGDARNPPASTVVPLRHEVRAASPGTTSLALSGPVSSEQFTTVPFSAAVTGANPTGTVQFKDGTTNLGAPVPLVGGSVTLRTSTLSQGSHSITASYGGDSTNAPSVSDVLVHTVYAALGTVVTLASGSNPAPFGSPLTITATVTGNSPTGNVVFRSGAAVLTTEALAGGAATAVVSGLASGVHELTATYSGDTNNQTVTSAVLFQQVSAQAVGTAPGAFQFIPRGNVVPGSVVTSNAIAVSGIASAVPIVVTGGSYSIGCTDSFSSASGMIAAGQVACVRHTASSAYGASTYTTLTIGGVSSTFTSMTYGATFTADVSALVARYYARILNRAPEPGGQEFWQAESARLVSLGANINEVWFVMANYFFNSPEYLAAHKDDAQFLTDVYNTFFDRPPDSGGFNFWLGQMQAGLSREGVIFWFMFSSEFRGFTQGIFGNTAARPEVDMVLDFFRGILNRFPDTAAFEFWVAQLRQAQCQGPGQVYAKVAEMSYLFLFQLPEYAGRNRDSTQFVSDMYNAFLRRGGAVEEVSFWIGQLTGGAKDRNRIRADFIDTPEFGARVNAVITAGCVR